MDPYLLQGIILSLLFSAFFSGIEIAFVSSDRLFIELQKEKGGLSARLLGSLVNNPSDFIATSLIGNTVSLVMYGKLMASALEPILEVYVGNGIGLMLIETLIATLIVLATAEFLPKSLFIINPNRMLSFFAAPFYLIKIVLFIPVKVVSGLSKLIIVHVFKQEYDDSQPTYGITDLNNYLKEIVNKRKTGNDQSDVDTKIFNNAIEFGNIKVRDCMIPRTELVAIEQSSTVSELSRLFVSSGHSKILVYKESIDEVVGYCHSTTLFKKPEEIKNILAPIMIVPETMHAKDLLVEFNREHKHIALVVDEFGGTAGVVTLEDVIEEIFGDIIDEHDEADLVENKIDDYNYILSARHDVDYLNKKYDFKLDEDGDYDTLGGLILAAAGDIPKVNEVILLEQGKIHIKSMDGIRIDKVKLELNADDD